MVNPGDMAARIVCTGDLLTGGEFVVIQQDVLTVDINGAYADTLDIDQFVDVLELTVFIPVCDDGFGLAHAYTFECFGDFLGIGGVDIDRLQGPGPDGKQAGRQDSDQ